jgi:hypothetical protein
MRGVPGEIGKEGTPGNPGIAGPRGESGIPGSRGDTVSYSNTTFDFRFILTAKQQCYNRDRPVKLDLKAIEEIPVRLGKWDQLVRVDLPGLLEILLK